MGKTRAPPQPHDLSRSINTQGNIKRKERLLVRKQTGNTTPEGRNKLFFICRMCGARGIRDKTTDSEFHPRCLTAFKKMRGR